MRFHVLLGVGKVVSFLGWIGVLIGLAMLVVFATGFVQTSQQVRIGGAGIGALAVIGSFVVVAFGQLLEVFVYIEHNTRTINHTLEGAAQPPSANRPYNP
jgi:hypothetical protein